MPVSALLNSSRRMARLIEDLLDFSRARLAGGITVQAEPGDLAEVARRVLQEHQASAPARSIELTQEGSLRADFDGERLAQGGLEPHRQCAPAWWQRRRDPRAPGWQRCRAGAVVGDQSR